MARKMDEQKHCDWFNAKYPVGTVGIVIKGHTYQETKTTSKAQLMCGQAVIWMENVSGSYKLDFFKVKE